MLNTFQSDREIAVTATINEIFAKSSRGSHHLENRLCFCHEILEFSQNEHCGRTVAVNRKPHDQGLPANQAEAKRYQLATLRETSIGILGWLSVEKQSQGSPDSDGMSASRAV